MGRASPCRPCRCDAVIQHIYPVFVASRSGSPISNISGTCCGSSGRSSIQHAPAAAFSGEFFGIVDRQQPLECGYRGHSCVMSEAQTLRLDGNDILNAQLVALAIYYTTASPPTSSRNLRPCRCPAGVSQCGSGFLRPFTSVADGSPIAWDLGQSVHPERHRRAQPPRPRPAR
jgi:hypothetical protein